MKNWIRCSKCGAERDDDVFLDGAYCDYIYKLEDGPCGGIWKAFGRPPQRKTTRQRVRDVVLGRATWRDEFTESEKG